MSRAPLIVLALILTSMSVSALDLGHYGPVYEIREKDFVEDMQARARAKVESGEWAKVEAESRRRVREAFEQPKPVSGISTVTHARTWLFDPAVVLKKSIVDHQGRVIYPAGTRVSPLDVVSLTTPLLFLDGRDPKQVTLARNLLAKGGSYSDLRPILVAGVWPEVGRSLGRQVWVDQDGALTGRLGLTRVPALVTQVERNLRIEEFVP